MDFEAFYSREPVSTSLENAIDDPPITPAWRVAWQAAFILVSLHLRCRTQRALAATIFSKVRPIQPGWRWLTAGQTGPTGPCCWQGRRVPARATAARFGPSKRAPPQTH